MQRLVYLFLIVAMVACKKEDQPLANTEPVTSLFLDTIIRSGEQRLNAIVKMSWTGDDQDGYVTGYEISLDNIIWTFTDKQDSTFKFSIVGSDTADIQLYVRAIDNDGNYDRSPASLRIPIKNTEPTIVLDDKMIQGDSVYSVFSLFWTISDLDGNETIDSVLVSINNATWFSVPKSINFISVIPDAPEQNGTSLATVLYGLNTAPSNKKIAGLVVGGSNIIRVKVRDLTGAESEVDSIGPFILRRKTSDLLVLDAFNISITPPAEPLYNGLISEVYGGFDYYDFYRQNKAYFPKNWKPTFSLLLSLYDKVVWYSDNTSPVNNLMLLEAGASAIQDYLNADGKILVLSDFANSAGLGSFPQNSTLFGFSAADSFQTIFASNQKYTLPQDSLLIPDATNAIGYPTLRASAFADAVDPFYPKSSAQVLYRAQVRKTNGQITTRVMAARTLNASGQTNQVFFSMDLYKLQGDANSNGVSDELKLFFDKVLRNEFNW